MIRFHFLARIALAASGVLLSVCQAQAVTLLYEPFDYVQSNFLFNTTVGAPNSATSPIGYLAPNFNNWYGTGIGTDAAPGTYDPANDGQITATDLSYAGLAKTGVTRSVTVGNNGYTMRLSLNSSAQLTPNKTGPNGTDTVDPLAGTDNTLQAGDTAHSGYYSILMNVGSISNLAGSSGGVLLGFNNLIGGQFSNPTTVGAGLTIRPKAGGAAGEFQLGIVKNGTANAASATWDTTHTYTTNSTIFVVGKYQTVGALQGGPPFDQDDIASLWINPASSTFGGYDPSGALTSTFGDDMATSITTNNHTLQSFVLRQTTISNNQVPTTVTYDELRIGTSYADVTPGLAGDFNGNGVVDAGDYVLWRDGGLLRNEVTGRGTVNASDFTDWRARYSNANAGSGAGAAVPEPAAIVLVMMSLGLLGVRRAGR